MKAKNITERIRDIKALIARANFKTAFDQLEQLIREIDGEDIENEQEREFINQLITIRARYNSFTDKLITGTNEAKQEQNHIIQSLLQLTDSIHELIEDNPDLIVPRTDEITANLSIPTVIPSTTHPVIPIIPVATDNGATNKGCLFSLSKSGDQTNLNVQANWLRFFIGAGIFILALAFGLKWIFTSDLPAETKPPPSTVETVPPPTKVENTVTSPKNSSVTIKDIANALSKEVDKRSGSYTMENVNFKKNSIELNTTAKNELDDLVIVLKQVPAQSFSITAAFRPDENPDFKGNKELTLGDARARAIFQYLTSRGIPATRMEFEGSGIKEEAVVEIKLE